MSEGGAAGAVLWVLNGFAFGGAERLASQITAHLVHGGRRVLVAAFADDDSEPDAGTSWFAPPCRVIRLSPAAQAASTLLEIIDREDVAVLVLCGRSPAYESLPALRGRRPHLRIVSFLFNARQLVTETRLLAPHVDAIIAESFDAAATLTAGNDAGLPVEIISSGVNASELAARPRPRDTDGPLCVAYVGRFDRSKNPAAFARMTRHLTGSRLRFLMAGSAPRSFRPPRGVELHRRPSDESLQELVDRIDILVVPSRNDGRPLIVQEAQARGIAVVASQVGAIPELVVHGKTGLLCPPDDDRALAAAVQRLAEDPELRHRLGEAGRERVLRDGELGRVLPRYAAAIIGLGESAGNAG